MRYITTFRILVVLMFIYFRNATKVTVAVKSHCCAGPQIIVPYSVLNICDNKIIIFPLKAVERSGNYELHFARQRFVRQAVCVKTDEVSFEFRKSKRYSLSILTEIQFV